MTDLPALSEILDTARVVALPMHTRFRGVDVREALLFEGPEGWAEFSPFTEYGDPEAATWLSAAIADAWHPRPAAVRDGIRVNATIPAVPAERVPVVLARFDGCRTAKVKVAVDRRPADRVVLLLHLPIRTRMQSSDVKCTVECRNIFEKTFQKHFQ